MNYLLDTNVLSELRKGQRCHANVAAWFASVPDHTLHLSVLVLGEIRCGIERIRRRDLQAASALETWLMQVVTKHHTRIFPVTPEVADVWGRMNALRPLSTIDSLLAATAQVYALTLVTRNVTDIVGTGVSYLNPFDWSG